MPSTLCKSKEEEYICTHPLMGAFFIAAHLTGTDLFRESGVNLKNIYFDTSSSKRIQGSDIKKAIDTFDMNISFLAQIFLTLE